MWSYNLTFALDGVSGQPHALATYPRGNSLQYPFNMRHRQNF